MEEKLVGTVVEIIYQSGDSGYTVAEIENEEDGIFTVTGYMPYLSVGENVAIIGRWIDHIDYGEQFKVESYETLLPTEENAIIRYLSSGIVPGIGPATAKNLVAHFGEETLDIMLKHPERLSEIRGISPKKAVKIGEEFLKLQSMQGIVMYLQKFSIGASMAVRVQKELGRDAVEKIKQNPYILSDTVDGIGFKTADEIAFFQGMPKNSPVRIRYGIKYILSESAFSAGHTYIEEKELVSYAARKLSVLDAEAKNGVDILLSEHAAHLTELENERRIALRIFAHAEDYIARRIMSMRYSIPSYMPSDKQMEEVIKKSEKESKIVLSDEQKRAVKIASENSVSIITGGPGTGKTTIINTIISLMKKINQDVVLAAPTGRAAKRMSKVTGCEAKTIHRLLGMKPKNEGAEFTYDETNPLEADVIIVDEASMIDVLLMSALLKAVKPGAKLILSGDSDQLPSVGPGNVLGDLISSGCIKTINLTNIYRQAEESLIVVNAHKINKGIMPDLKAKDKDFFFLKRRDAEIIGQTIVELYKTRLPASYKINPISNIQVISPSKKGICGTEALNKELQFAMNPPDMLRAEYKRGSTTFRVGDKVMQIKNDYDIMWSKETGEVGCGIFNGDMGIIADISIKDKFMTIIFDDKEVEYPFSDLDKIDLAYAVTVHKSQGSEFPFVLIPAFSFAPMLMYKNLLYTAVTRAKDMVVMVGRAEEIERMVKNKSRHIRRTMLVFKINKIDKEINEEKGL